METFPSANEMMCIILCLPSNQPTYLPMFPSLSPPTSEPAARQSINLVLLWITLTLSVFIFQVSSCGRRIYLSLWRRRNGLPGKVKKAKSAAVAVRPFDAALGAHLLFSAGRLRHNMTEPKIAHTIKSSKNECPRMPFSHITQLSYVISGPHCFSSPPCILGIFNWRQLRGLQRVPSGGPR